MTDNGFLKLDNSIIDYWMSRLNHSEFKTLLTIYRKTVGWNKQYDKISQNQISTLSGITTRSVRSAITSLEDLGLIITTGKNKSSKVFTLNLERLYNVCLKSDEALEMESKLENISNSSENNTTLYEKDSIDDDENCLHKRHSKDTTNKQIKDLSESDEINIPFSDFWTKYDYAKGKQSDIKSKWLSLTNEERTLTMQSLDRYLLSTPDKRYRKYPMSYLNTEAWNDEVILPSEQVNGVDSTAISKEYSPSFKGFDTDAHNHTKEELESNLESLGIKNYNGNKPITNKLANQDALSKASQVHWSELKAKGLLKKQVNPSTSMISESKQKEIDDFLARNGSKGLGKNYYAKSA